MPATTRPRVSELSLEEFLATYPRMAGASGESGTGDDAGAAATGDAATGDAATGAAAGAAATGDAAATGTPATPPGEEGLPDAVKAILKKERDARRDAERRATQAEGQVATFEQEKLSDLEKQTQRAEKAEREAAELKATVMRSRVAAAANLPAELAELLKGDTEEALTEHAQRLAAFVPKGDGAEQAAGQTAGTGFDGGQRGSGPARLTMAQIEAMSPAEINRRWDEVQAALQSN